MTRCFPNARMHQDPSIKTHHIASPMNERAPPELLYVVLELDSEWSVIPGIGESAVKIRAGVNKSAPLAKRNDFFHGSNAWGSSHREAACPLGGLILRCSRVDCAVCGDAAVDLRRGDADVTEHLLNVTKLVPGAKCMRR